jgi:hypothetical protein
MQGEPQIHSTGESPLTKSRYLWLLGLVFVAGAGIRLYRIGEQIILDDEWHALNAVQYFDFGWIFTHFSTADISIPLAMLYELQYRVVGLNEILMRWPMLAAGSVAILLLPRLLRHWLSRPERLILAMLIAVSPFLIYYSRFARPYMLLVLLEPGALVLAWHWWNGGKVIHGAGWILCAALSAWFNSPALAVVTAPFAWFGLIALRRAGNEEGRKDLARLFMIGLVMLAALGVLLGPPLLTDFGSIAAKAGQHLVGFSTLVWAVSLASGSGHAWVFLPIALLAVLGLVTLYQRDAAFVRFLLTILLLAMVAVSLAGAAWVKEGPVFLRYLIGLLPFYLASAAVGLVRAVSWLVHRSGVPAAVNWLAYPVLILLLVGAGPIPDWPMRTNQFMTHLNYHFHYDRKQNPFVYTFDDWYREEPFYAEIAGLHPAGDAVIVEAPWYLESYNNALNLRQETHGQKVLIGFINGLCAGPLYGELGVGQSGMKFRNFVYLQELLDGTREADYLVLRRRSMSPAARVIEMDFAKCELAVREKFGAPWRETENALVFRPGAAP